MIEGFGHSFDCHKAGMVWLLPERNQAGRIETGVVVVHRAVALQRRAVTLRSCRWRCVGCWWMSIGRGSGCVAFRSMRQTMPLVQRPPRSKAHILVAEVESDIPEASAVEIK